VVADGFQGLQIVFEIGDELRPEILGGKLFGFLLFQQPFDAFLIVGFEQLKNLSDMFLADEDLAFVKLRDDALVGVDEAPERGQECGETAFEAFHRKDFHELGKVALALGFLRVALSGVVGQRHVAGVFEVVRQRTDRLIENFGLGLVELVEERFGVGDFGKLEALALQVFAVVFVNLGAGAADHQELEDFLAGLARVFLNRAEIDLAVVLPVESFKPATERAEEGFEIADARNGALLSGLEQLDLAQDVLRRVVERRGGNQNDARVPFDNNRAEREIRPAVIARRNSLHNTSDQGAWTQAVLMTIYRTLKLRGQDPIETISDTLTLFIATGELPGLPTAKPPG